jgi:crotonobetainyl-CoA:carnitine CoA-transferase CaiB-like acyl-CoA transferase
MKPEDKARELILIYYSLIPMNTISFAKKCALIAVDELIYETSFEVPNIRQRYWQEVKQEIEKL